MMLKIVSAPDPVLSSIAKPVVKINSHILKLIKDMEESLLSAKDPVGVGLAAPQIGQSLRIFIVKPTPKSKIQVFINPTMIHADQKPIDTDSHPREPAAKSAKSSTKLEGCLSLPNIWGQVLRASSVTLSYLDEKGQHHEKKFSNFLATIIQHEMDHLDGILFPRRVLEQKGTLYKSHKNEKNEDEFEEVDL